MHHDINTIQAYVKKAGRTFELDLGETSEAGVRYLLEYGLKQSLADSVADAANYATQNDMKLADAIDVLIEKRYRRIQDGTVGSGGGGGDPVAKHVRTLLRQALGAKKWKALDKATRDQKVAAIVNGEGNEKAQAIREEAERRAEAEAIDATDLDV